MSKVPARTETRVDHLRALARLLDTAFRVPGTPIRFGVDSILGLLPGLGDAIGAMFSGYIVLQAARLGASASVVARMLLNLGIDALVGAIPLLGDAFDVGWRANTRNLTLLDRHLADPRGTGRASAVRLFAAGTAVVLVLAAIAFGAVFLIRALLRHSTLF